jgi:hypothetical protein
MPNRPAESTAHRPDPEVVARHVNVAWALTRDRMARHAVVPTPDPISYRIEALEREVERLVAALAERAR